MAESSDKIIRDYWAQIDKGFPKIKPQIGGEIKKPRPDSASGSRNSGYNNNPPTK